MKNEIRNIGIAILIFVSNCIQAQEKKEQNNFLWSPGYMDIHHISTGNGDAAFYVFPDGTTMMFDAGELNYKHFNDKYYPLKASSPLPSDSLNVAGWILNYIRQVQPATLQKGLNYLVVSHYHSDHYGAVDDLMNKIKIHKIIDRDIENLDFPVDLKQYYQKDLLFNQYLSAIKSYGSEIESLNVGSKDQITLLSEPDKYPTFTVRNVKSNGTIWTGEGSNTFEYLHKDSVVNEKGKFNENPLSLAIKISYGKFDYFTGGDMTGLQSYGKPSWFDVETPVAKVVGQVEVTTLNHHGNRDATNENFVEALAPRVVVQQSWCSDHPGQEVYERLISESLYEGERDLFATNIHEETKVTLGPWFTKAYKSMSGHIMIRVLPGGEKYYVFVLNDTNPKLEMIGQYGPYTSN